MSIQTNKSGLLNSQFSERKKKRTQLRHIIVGSQGIIGLFGMTLSLFHLSSGLHEETGDTILFSWFLAVVIDMGIIAVKAGLIYAKVNQTSGVHWWAVPYLIVSFIFSCGLNARSLTMGKEMFSYQWWFCVALGCFISSAVFVLGNVMAALMLNRKTYHIGKSKTPPNLNTVLTELSSK